MLKLITYKHFITVFSNYIAYIRKHFYQTPVSENVPEGGTIHMHCSPPEGEPKVQVKFFHDLF
ncbi:unnamed protein product [Brugia timori]|uniref:Uncharacterized protein n=1 Tax=Brugia timori TaxID=42155 RepID=A0A0R3QYR9_9BILA|nr:unnamed protein product [Brugia timori]